jgi:hypothetical protein
VSLIENRAMVLFVEVNVRCGSGSNWFINEQ